MPNRFPPPARWSPVAKHIRHNPGFGIAAQIVGRNAGNANLDRIPPEHLPDDFLAEALARNGAAASHWPENMSGGDARRRSPCIDRHLHPRRHRRGADAPVFSDEIDDAPPAIALLDVCKCERGHFRTAQSAAKEDGENGAIPQPGDSREIWRAQ
jgi:hypothetical protein